VTQRFTRRVMPRLRRCHQHGQGVVGPWTSTCSAPAIAFTRMGNDDKQRLLTARQAAEYLGITSGELDLLIRAGQIPAVRAAGDWQLDRVDIDRWLHSLESQNRNGKSRAS
jgi:excisionase family DNA binding protein